MFINKHISNVNFNRSSVREGFKKTIMENSIYGPNHLPPRLWKKFIFFSETRPFFENFYKKCIFAIENPKKNFSKNDKTTFKQANFCLLRCQILPRHAQ